MKYSLDLSCASLSKADAELVKISSDYLVLEQGVLFTEVEKIKVSFLKKKVSCGW